MKSLSLLALILLMLLSSCAAPVSITPKPNVQPVIVSNKKAKQQVHEISTNTHEEIQINQDLQGDIESAIREADKILNR